MISWPPHGEPMAYESLKEFKGNKLIFVGEDQGGCTGCDKFFNLLYENWKLVNRIEIPQWFGLHDSLFLFSRKFNKNARKKRK